MPWRRKWQPTLVFSPRKFHGQTSIAGNSPQGRKELDATECVSPDTQGNMLCSSMSEGSTGSINLPFPDHRVF